MKQHDQKFNRSKKNTVNVFTKQHFRLSQEILNTLLKGKKAKSDWMPAIGTSNLKINFQYSLEESI